MNPIYLDYAASTPVKPQVVNIFTKSLNIYGNPSSVHEEGLKAKRLIDNASNIIANKLNCLPEEIYYTTGATMSNNLLIQGFKKHNTFGYVVTSAVEHNDIIELVNSHICDLFLPVNKNGILELQGFENITNNLFGKCLISIQMANSETGVIQPIKEISEIIHKNPYIYLHVDATQYLPYYPIDVQELGIDALSMSGQKIGGIKGSGLLYVRQTLLNEIEPVIHGEQGFIGGTPSTPLIASLGEAFQLIDYNVDELQNKRDFLLEKLEQLGGILIGSREHRIPNNIYIRFPGISGMTLMNLLNGYKIYIGTGSACSTDSDKPSHVALAYGLTPEEALECVRFSLGNENTYEELNYTAQVVKGLIETLR